MKTFLLTTIAYASLDTMTDNSQWWNPISGVIVADFLLVKQTVWDNQRKGGNI